MLWGIVPRDVVRRRKDEIYEVMDELAGIVVEEDGSSWSNSRKRCLMSACRHFEALALADTNLEPKLKRLVRTLRFE